MIVSLIAWCILPILGVSALLCGWRALRGPSLPDRVVGLEMLTTLGIGMAACIAVSAGQPALLDVGLALALVAFLGAIAFAWVMEARP